MEWYFYLAIMLILSQLAFLCFIIKNYRYVLKKYNRRRWWYRPKTALIVPCKGLEPRFDQNISSFFQQDYDNYLLYFVVEDKQDPAYKRLCELTDNLRSRTQAAEVRILVAGRGKTCSRKIHNLLHGYRQIPEDVEILAFADSDACVNNDWLSHIVYPLRKDKNGVAAGYRWFVPAKNNLASIALSAVNAKIAQLLGNSRFNQAWGGSMAVRVDLFRKLGLPQIWQNVLSDDLSLSSAVKKAGFKIVFVPACLVASYESTTWAKLFEFGRRQFLITRIYAPKTWCFALLSSLYSVLGLFATAVVAVWAVKNNIKWAYLYTAVPLVFFSGQLLRAILRQKMIAKLLPKDVAKMTPAMAADIALFWLWTVLMLIFILVSALGRTIKWRGITYHLTSRKKTTVLQQTRQI